MKNIISKFISIILVTAMIASFSVSFAYADEPQSTSVNYGYVPDTRLRDYDYNTMSFPQASNPSATSVDLTADGYFPEIIDQGDALACTVYAMAYYQFTYETNRLHHTLATDTSPYCPQYVYSLVQNGYGEGVGAGDCYDVLQLLGCLKYSDYDITDIDTLNEFINYKSTNDDAKIEALKTRIEKETILVNCTIERNGQIVDKAHIISPGGQPLTNSDMCLIKSRLVEGRVLCVGCHFYPEYKTGTNGEQAIVYCADEYEDSVNHVMTIVGYDDNFECDIDGNGTIEYWEKGAFKVANSQGTDYGNNGFIWVMYDAFNIESYSDYLNSTVEGRMPFVEVVEATCGKKYHEFFDINVVENNPTLIGCVEMTGSKARNLNLQFTRSDENGLFNNTVYQYPQSYYEVYFHDSYTYNLIFDFCDLTDNQFDFLSGYYWRFALLGRTENVTCNSIKLIDDKQNIIDERCLSGNVPTNSPRYEDFYLDIMLGDVNYDGELGSSDIKTIKKFILGTQDPSTIQSYIADYDGDEEVTLLDVRAIERAILGSPVEE